MQRYLRIAFLLCTLGFVPAVVPLISPAYDFYPGIKIAAGIFNCALGYAGFGCGFYNVLAGKLFPVCKQVKYQPFSLFGFGGVVAARAGQQLVGGDVLFAYPRKARFGVKTERHRLALRRKRRFVMDDNAHIRFSLHAPDQQDAPCCGAEVDRT